MEFKVGDEIIIVDESHNGGILHLQESSNGCLTIRKRYRCHINLSCTTMRNGMCDGFVCRFENDESLLSEDSGYCKISHTSILALNDIPKIVRNLKKPKQWNLI